MEHMNWSLMGIGYMYIIQERRMERSLPIPLTTNLQTMIIHGEARPVSDYDY